MPGSDSRIDMVPPFASSSKSCCGESTGSWTRVWSASPLRNAASHSSADSRVGSPASSKGPSVDIDPLRLGGEQDCEILTETFNAFSQSLGCQIRTHKRATQLITTVICEGEVNDQIHNVGEISRLVLNQIFNETIFLRANVLLRLRNPGGCLCRRG